MVFDASRQQVRIGLHWSERVTWDRSARYSLHQAGERSTP